MAEFQQVYKLFFKNKKARDFQPFAFKSYDNAIDDIFKLLNNPQNNIVMLKNDEENKLTHQLRIKFIGLSIQQYPMNEDQVLTPQYCTLYFKSYQVSVNFEDIELQYVKISNDNPNDMQVQVFKDVIDITISKEKKFFNLPVMVGSQKCTANWMQNIISDDNLAQQFIVHGKQKIIVPFERMNTNEVVTFTDSEGLYYTSCSSKSFIDQFTNINKLTIRIKEGKQKIKQQHEYQDICVKLQQMKEDTLIQKNMSVFILFYALGTVNDRTIVDLCSMKDPNIEYFVQNCMQNFKTYYWKQVVKKHNDRNKQVSEVVAKKKQDIEKQDKEEEQDSEFSLQEISLYFLEHQKVDKLGQKSIKQIIIDNVLPHINYYESDVTNLHLRSEFLGFMVYSLVATYLGYQKPQIRDSYMFKRCISVGSLLFSVFEDVYKKKLKEIRKKFQNLEINEQVIRNNSTMLSSFLYSNDITSLIQKPLQTGQFSQKLVGVAQPYKVGSMFSMYLQNRKISNNPTVGANSKKIDTKYVDAYTSGYIANEESVEGENIGSVFSFAITSDLTTDHNQSIPLIFEVFEEYAEEYGLRRYNINNCERTKIIIQGILRYTVKNPSAFIKKFKEFRSTSKISQEISYYINEQLNFIQIFTDQGRYIRPVIQVDENNKSKITSKDIEDILNGKYKDFNDFVNKNKDKIHYLELRESQNVIIAENSGYLQLQRQKQKDLRAALSGGKYSDLDELTNVFQHSYIKYDYLDIHPSIMNGALSGAIYFFNHNPGNRNIMTCAQKKRTVQEQVPDTHYVFNKKVYYLINGDRQIIRTIQSDSLRTSRYASGQLMRVMISFAGGNDQEDSIVFRQSSAEKLYLQTFEDIYESEASKQQADVNQKFTKPPPQDRNENWNYDKINEQGFIQPGTIVKKGDVIIGKIEQFIPSGKQQTPKFIDLSVEYKGEYGIVVQSIQSTTKDSIQKITIKIKNYTFPQIGDKMAVFTGGCKCTIAAIMRDDKMPYFEDGSQPDVIMNIHSFANRRPMGILFEGIISQLAILGVQVIDATAFQDGVQLLDQTNEILKQNNLPEWMKMKRYDPVLMKYTGDVFRAGLYFHMLDSKPKDKIYSVDLGCASKTLFTRQPVAGKNKRGAIKLLGELEKSALLAQNASFFTNELMNQHCDGDVMYICTTCYNVADLDKQSQKHVCNFCDKGQIQQIQIAYSLMQLNRILRSMGIDLKFVPQKTISQILQEAKQVGKQ